MSQPSGRDPNMRAAEYVLGTLSADEAARVERELERDSPESHELQIEVAYWEEQLGQLGLRLPPVEPPAEAWEAIRTRLHEHAHDLTHQDTRRTAPAAPEIPRRRASRLWQGWAIAASIAALVLAGLLFVVGTRPVQVAPPTYASMFYDNPTSTGWLLTASADTGEMSVTAMGDYPLPKGKELRLWIIPEGGKPIASGIVPAHGAHSWAMSTRVAQVLRDPATVVAVSMEDAGQPVSDGPQGPVMWQAPVRQRTS